MAINKLNKTFRSKQILTSSEMNLITSKVDEIIEVANTHDTDIENSSKVTAAALVENATDIESLKNILTDVITGKILADSLMTKEIKIKGAKDTIIADNTPNIAPDFIGQKWIDKIGRKAYISVGTESVSDWITITN